MSLRFIPRTFFFFIFILSLGVHPAFAQEKRVGLANYDIVSGENVDYLKKAVREALSASLKERGAVTLVEINQSEEEIKKKGAAKVIKSEKVDAIITGSIVKLGAPVQINTRIYGPSGAEEPALVSVTVDSLDRLLPTLKTHSQSILDQLDRMGSAGPAVAEPKAEPKKEEKKKEVAATPPPAPVPVPTQTPPPAPTPVKEKTPEPKVVKEEAKAPEPKPSAKKSEKAPTPTAEAKAPSQDSLVTSPDYRWMSERLPFEGRGLAYEDLDGDGKKEIILIDIHHVYVYELSGKQLRLLKTYEGREDDHFVRVYTLDVTGDGKPEILVSNIRNDRAVSLGLRYDSSGLTPVFKDSPWLLKVISWEGRPLLVGEVYLGDQINYHKIRKLRLEGAKLVEMEDLKTPSEVGIYGLSDFKPSAQEGGGILYLTPSGSLKIYEDANGKYKKRWSSSERYGGSSNWINQKVENMFNEVNDYKTYINIDPVAWNGNGQGEVLVARNDTFLKNIVGTRPIVKNCWFTKLKWDELGLRESWSSRKIDGYIADNIRAQLPGEKSPQILSLLWLRDPGFASTMGTFKSVLAVYDPN